MQIKSINIQIKNQKIIVESPYDRELVADIKGIDPKQRKYESKKWFVDLEDPSQQDDEPTNIEYIRRICSEAAERNGWLLADSSVVCVAQEDFDTSKQSEDNMISVNEFIQSLNNYTGDNIWQEIIYAVELVDDQIDYDRTEDDKNNDTIFLLSGEQILWWESEDYWLRLSEYRRLMRF